MLGLVYIYSTVLCRDSTAVGAGILYIDRTVTIDDRMLRYGGSVYPTAVPPRWDIQLTVSHRGGIYGSSWWDIRLTVSPPRSTAVE